MFFTSKRAYNVFFFKKKKPPPSMHNTDREDARISRSIRPYKIILLYIKSEKCNDFSQH